MNTNADARLYAAAIAIVSGIYSIASSIAGGMVSMPISASVMLVVGVIVLLQCSEPEPSLRFWRHSAEEEAS